METQYLVLQGTMLCPFSLLFIYDLLDIVACKANIQCGVFCLHNMSCVAGGLYYEFWFNSNDDDNNNDDDDDDDKNNWSVREHITL